MEQLKQAHVMLRVFYWSSLIAHCMQDSAEFPHTGRAKGKRWRPAVRLDKRQKLFLEHRFGADELSPRCCFTNMKQPPYVIIVPMRGQYGVDGIGGIYAY
jgi:hypothetical protein